LGVLLFVYTLALAPWCCRGERRARLNGPTLAAQIETQTSFFTARRLMVSVVLTWEERILDLSTLQCTAFR